MKILICGASGYIGNKMFKYFKKKGYEVDGTYYKNKINSFFEFSLKTNEELEKKIMIKKYDIIIWAIGFKDLLKTEIFQGDIYKINISLLNLFIQKLNKFNLNPKLIYISTDYVFDGQKGEYLDTDKPNPRTNYGLSKYLAELMIDDLYPNYTIVRTAAVISNGSNFIKWIKDQIKINKTINFYSDSYFSPTPLSIFLKGIEKVFKNEGYQKTFHLSGNFKMSRDQLGELLFDGLGKNKKQLIKKIETEQHLDFMKGDISLISSKYFDKYEFREFEKMIIEDIR